jgi:hypothetical protein
MYELFKRKATNLEHYRNIHTGLDAIAFGSLFTWAWLELFQGVNYFRRALGFIVLLFAIASRLSWS